MIKRPIHINHLKLIIIAEGRRICQEKTERRGSRPSSILRRHAGNTCFVSDGREGSNVLCAEAKRHGSIRGISQSVQAVATRPRLPLGPYCMVPESHSRCGLRQFGGVVTNAMVAVQRIFSVILALVVIRQLGHGCKSLEGP